MENNNFKMGVRDGMPIGLGYLAVSFAFGILAVGAGLNPLQAVLISMLNLTSAGQLAALPIICGMGSLLELVITQAIINARYALMSLSLSQRLSDKVRLRDKSFIAFINTDEIFASANGKCQPLGFKYFLGIAIPPIIGWNLGTLFGAVSGNILPEVLLTALGIALYAMFIATVVPAAKDNMAILLCVIITVIISCTLDYATIFSFISEGFKVIISSLFASVVMALLRPVRIEEGTKNG